MSSSDSTMEALSIVDKLKLCILKQDKIIRAKSAEIDALKERVSCLEKERAALKRKLMNGEEEDLAAVDCAVVDLENPDTSTRVVQSPPNVSTSSASTVTPDKEPNTSSPSKGSLKVKMREASVKRNDSLTRNKSFNKKYELSPDLQERSLMLLERKYGGKEKAHHAAKVIQSYYRKYVMDKSFKRIRAYSETPDKILKTKTQPKIPEVNIINSDNIQTTPVLRLVKKHVIDRNNKVRSTLIIDNITPYHPGGPVNLERHFQSVTLSPSNEEKPPLEQDQKNLSDDEGQNVIVTEHCVKVEAVELVATSPVEEDVFTPGKSHVANGDVPHRTRRSTTGDDSDESLIDAHYRKLQDMSSLDSLDSVSHLDANLDTISISSEFEAVPASSLKPQKLEMRIGINHFNRKPEKGIEYLISHQVLEDNPQLVAKFLITEHGISKQKLGEYLGNIQNDFNMAVLKCFTESLEFTGMEIDVALRIFLSYFRIPGEAQKIERLMEMFSEQYLYCNPSDDKAAHDKVLILAFAIVMLNTDLHSPSVKKKMSESDFIKNLAGANNGGNFPQESLSGIYRRILKREFAPARDHVTMTIKLETKIVGKMPWTTLAAPHRYLRMTTQLYEVQDPNKRDKIHSRILFLFNDMLVVTKERGKSGQRDSFHFYSYKHSFPLVGVTISLFNNDYYLYGIQFYSRIQSKVLATFNATDEPSRNVVVEEVMECIDETNTMESDRITTEKQKQLASGRFERNPGTMTLPHPKKRRGKAMASADTLSLHEESMSSSLSSSSLMTSRQLSNSMLNISDGDMSFSPDIEGIKRCNSSSSLDSAFVDGETSQSNNGSPHTESVSSAGSKVGIFKKWRSKNSRSLGRTTPTSSPVQSPKIVHKTIME